MPKTYRFEPRLIEKVRRFMTTYEIKPKEVDLVAAALDEYIDRREGKSGERRS